MAAPHEQGPRPKRNRIIINLERAREAAHIPRMPSRGSRGAKILGIIVALFLLVILAVGLGVFLWWQSYKKSPAYSLALLVDAVQRNDEAAFNDLVDTDKIVENFVPQVTEKAIGRYAAALTEPIRKQVEAQVPKLLPTVKAMVKDEVTKKIKEMSARAEGKPFILIALGMPYVVDVKEEGDKAQVMANLPDRQVELTMVRNGEQWRIVAVKDDTMAARIVDNIMKNLPAVGSQALDKARKDLEKKLPKDLQKNLPKNTNVPEDIKKNLPNIPGITDNNSNSNDNSNGNSNNDNNDEQ